MLSITMHYIPKNTPDAIALFRRRNTTTLTDQNHPGVCADIGGETPPRELFAGRSQHIYTHTHRDTVTHYRLNDRNDVI